MRMYFTLNAGQDIPAKPTVYTDYIQFEANGKTYVFDVLSIDYTVEGRVMDARVKEFSLLSIDSDVVDKEISNEEFSSLVKALDPATFVIGAFIPDEYSDDHEIDFTGEYTVSFEWGEDRREFTGVNKDNC